jgi:hypothetical protein
LGGGSEGVGQGDESLAVAQWPQSNRMRSVSRSPSSRKSGSKQSHKH